MQVYEYASDFEKVVLAFMFGAFLATVRDSSPMRAPIVICMSVGVVYTLFKLLKICNR
jgi:hypothetical protein